MKSNLIIIVVFLLVSCSGYDNEILDKNTFKSSTNHQIISPHGTIIYIPEDCFEYENGKEYNGIVKFELKEVFTKEGMIKNDLTTSSHDRMLVSLGMFHLSAKTANDENLEIKKTKSIYICAELGVERNNSRYKGFYGIREDDEINWVSKMEIENDQITGTCSELPDCLGSFIFHTRKLGWINCDYFESVNLFGSLTIVSNEKDIKIRLVFDNLNSIMPLRKTGEIYKQNRLPLKRKATILAYKESNDKIKYYQKKIVIDTIQQFDIVLEEIEISEFEERIKNL